MVIGNFQGNLMAGMILLESVHRSVANNEAEHVQAIQNAEGHTTAFVLVEIALVVTLTPEHTTISHLAAKSLRYLAWLESLTGAPPALAMDGDLLSKRHLVYEQLSDPRILIAGPGLLSLITSGWVGYQKRIRNLLRLRSMLHFGRSATFAGSICTTSLRIPLMRQRQVRKPGMQSSLVQRRSFLDAADVSQEKRHAYEIFGLYLASLGGACVQDGVDLTFLPAQYLPDQMRKIQNPVPLVTKFINALTDRLMLSSVRYHIENTPVNSEEIMSIDISATPALLSCVHRSVRATSSLADVLNLQRDYPALQKILDILAEWRQSLRENGRPAGRSLRNAGSGARGRFAKLDGRRMQSAPESHTPPIHHRRTLFFRVSGEFGQVGSSRNVCRGCSLRLTASQIGESNWTGRISAQQPIASDTPYPSFSLSLSLTMLPPFSPEQNKYIRDFFPEYHANRARMSQEELTAWTQQTRDTILASSLFRDGAPPNASTRIMTKFSNRARCQDSFLKKQTSAQTPALAHAPTSQLPKQEDDEQLSGAETPMATPEPFSFVDQHQLADAHTLSLNKSESYQIPTDASADFFQVAQAALDALCKDYPERAEMMLLFAVRSKDGRRQSGIATAHSGIRPADIADIRDAEIDARWNEFTEAALPAEHQVNRLPFAALDLDNCSPTLVKERVIGYFIQLWNQTHGERSASPWSDPPRNSSTAVYDHSKFTLPIELADLNNVKNYVYTMTAHYLQNLLEPFYFLPPEPSDAMLGLQAPRDDVRNAVPDGAVFRSGGSTVTGANQQPISFAPAFAQHSTSKHEVGHSVDGPALTGEDLTSAAARGVPYLFGAHNAFTDKHTVGPITKVTEDIEPEQSVPGLPQPRRLPSLSTDMSEDVTDMSEDEGEAKSGPLQVETLGDEHDKKASKGAVRGGSSRGRRSGEHVHSANPKRKQQDTETPPLTKKARKNPPAPAATTRETRAKGADTQVPTKYWQLGYMLDGHFYRKPWLLEDLQSEPPSQQRDKKIQAEIKAWDGKKRIWSLSIPTNDAHWYREVGEDGQPGIYFEYTKENPPRTNFRRRYRTQDWTLLVASLTYRHGYKTQVCRNSMVDGRLSFSVALVTSDGRPAIVLLPLAISFRRMFLTTDTPGPRHVFQTSGDGPLPGTSALTSSIHIRFTMRHWAEFCGCSLDQEYRVSSLTCPPVALRLLYRRKSSSCTTTRSLELPMPLTRDFARRAACPSMLVDTLPNRPPSAALVAATSFPVRSAAPVDALLCIGTTLHHRVPRTDLSISTRNAIVGCDGPGRNPVQVQDPQTHSRQRARSIVLSTFLPQPLRRRRGGSGSGARSEREVRARVQREGGEEERAREREREGRRRERERTREDEQERRQGEDDLGCIRMGIECIRMGRMHRMHPEERGSESESESPHERDTRERDTRESTRESDTRETRERETRGTNEARVPAPPATPPPGLAWLGFGSAPACLLGFLAFWDLLLAGGGGGGDDPWGGLGGDPPTDLRSISVAVYVHSHLAVIKTSRAILPLATIPG
ncbi:hypothetical protein GGX14DRAFT_399374 [Mycena pura]|uniref:Uncharacterized protein n=1 Tax=Mycena pura TaxID=153505 RepID=A0AAD6Y8R4_9AGAR|nr:hypothetical protein GGX14DRAFT_399374 [Mycena pura]